jgi:hypothetical protein
MAKQTVQQFVEQAREASLENKQRSSGLTETGFKIERVTARRSIKRALIWLGFGLGFLALASGDSWVAESPLFNILGTGGCSVSLCICWAAGGLWWLVRGSEEVCLWAKSLLPACVQPYRSIAGIPVVFIVIRLASDGLFWISDRLPWTGKNRLGLVTLFRRGLWLLAATAWLAALALTTVRLAETGWLRDRMSAHWENRKTESVPGSSKKEKDKDNGGSGRKRQSLESHSKNNHNYGCELDGMRFCVRTALWARRPAVEALGSKMV